MRLRVALCQLESHPALCASHTDFLEEPFPPGKGAVSLSLLGLKGVDVADLQRACRERYLEWAATRLAAVFAYLRSLEPCPQLVLFPEGGVAPQHLNAPTAYSEQTGAVVLAGTHTPRTGSGERATYRDAGVEGAALDEILAADCRNALPLICAGRTTLVPKAFLSPLDRSVIEPRPSADGRRPFPLTFGDEQLEILPLICSEALQAPQVEGAPDLIGICAYDAKPKQFSNFCVEQVRNKRFALLCNDGRFGGSRVFAAADTRRRDWLGEAFPDGMPAGDIILVVDLDLSARAIEVGTATPAMAVQLVATRSVLAEDTAAAGCTARLRSIRALEGADERAQALQSLIRDTSLKFQRTRFHAIAEQERRGLPCSSWWDTLGDDVLISGAVSLKETERQLATRCHAALAAKLSGSLGGEETRSLVDYLQRCEAVSRAVTDRTSPSRPPSPPPAAAVPTSAPAVAREAAPSRPAPPAAVTSPAPAVAREAAPSRPAPAAPLAAPAGGAGLDPTVRLALTMHANPGAYACLVGSGISASSGIPTGWGIVLDLCARVASVLGERCGDDPASWYAARFGEDPDYAKLLARIASTPAERSRLLRGYFEPTEEERRRGVKGPTAAHRALAALAKQGAVRLFVTTNFDRLLERALQDVNIAPMVVASPDDLSAVPPLGQGEVTLIKVHGDYLDARIKNTPEELDRYDPAVNALLDRVFGEHGLIVCGWSGQWDTGLVRAIERSATAPYGTFWTDVRPPKGAAARLLALRRGEFVQIDGADTFFPTLAERVTTLIGRREAPPPRAESALAPSSLPSPTSAFVGRKALLAMLAERLAEARLLTLHGAGGVGKTRLAVELARKVTDEHPDGVWFIDLAPETDPHHLREVVADVLGVAAERLKEVLAGRRTLLVIDNCEHLVEAVAALVDPLLEAAPQLTVLATSRARLGLPYERVHAVVPMELPAEGASDVPGIERSEAVQLFVERARDVNDRFALTASNAADVARVVRTLDGVPLALELAAARTRVLPVGKLADRLTDVFKVLPRGLREARPHQETLAAVWDWSWELLTAAEHRLCERLSVFRGGFTLEAAEQVAAGEALPAEDVLDAFAELVDKSMIAPLPGEEGRYGMLEMVRQYAAQRLEQRGETAAVRKRHARFFLDLARSAPATLGLRHPDEMYRQLVGEDDNLHAVAEWLLAHEQAEDALVFTTALSWFFWYRRKGELVCGWLERALEAAGDVAPELRARGLGIAGWLGFNADRERAQRRLEEASTHLEQLGCPIEATWFALCRAANQLMLGDIDGAANVLASDGCRRLPRRSVAYVAMQAMSALVHLARGELAEALAASDEGLRYQRDTYELMPPLHLRLAVLRLRARADELRKSSERSLVGARTQRDPVSAISGLQGLAFAQILEGDVPGALATTHSALDTLALFSRGELVFFTGAARIGPPRPGDAEAGADLVEHLLKQPRAQASRRFLELLLKASVRAATAAGEQEGATRLGQALERLQAASVVAPG